MTVDLFGQVPEPGARIRHRANGLVGRVVSVEHRIKTWVVIRRPVPAEWPHRGWVDSDVELRIDRFLSEWEAAP